MQNTLEVHTSHAAIRPRHVRTADTLLRVTNPDDPYAGRPAPEHSAAPEQPATPPVQPAYYGQPTPYYYGPPTPNPPSRVAWFAIGAGSMLALGLVGLFVLGLIISIVEDESDGDGGLDEDSYSYYYVDQQSVLNAVEEPCKDMIDAGRQIHPFDEPKQAVGGIKEFAVTAQKVADAIGTADPNSDSQLWRKDWETLADDLNAYADNLATLGRDTEFGPLVPTDEAPVMFRMALSSEADCEVPAIVVALDTQNAGTYSDYYY